MLTLQSSQRPGDRGTALHAPPASLEPGGRECVLMKWDMRLVLESFTTAAGQSWAQCTSDSVPAFPLPLLFRRLPGASCSVQRALPGRLLRSLRGTLPAIVDSVMTAAPSTPRFLCRLSLLSPHPCTHPPLPPSRTYWLPGTVEHLSK